MAFSVAVYHYQVCKLYNLVFSFSFISDRFLDTCLLDNDITDTIRVKYLVRISLHVVGFSFNSQKSIGR